MKDKEADIGIWYEINPPAFVPLSARARAHMDLPDPCDGVVLLDSPARVLSTFPDDYMVVNLADDEGPHTLAIGDRVYAESLH